MSDRAEVILRALLPGDGTGNLRIRFTEVQRKNLIIYADRLADLARIQTPNWQQNVVFNATSIARVVKDAFAQSNDSLRRIGDL